MTDTNYDRRMWEVLNIILPSESRRRQKSAPGLLIPLADQRVNAIFPKDSKKKKDKSK